MNNAGSAFDGIPIRHVGARVGTRVLGHIAHELRHVPKVWSLRTGQVWGGGAVPACLRSLLLSP